MSKKRKLHQLIGVIKYCWGGISHSKTYKNQPFYSLEVELQSLFAPKKTAIYVFANLVSQGIWNTLKQKTFAGKTYHFFCEKRVRGWRLKEWEEVEE